MKNRVLGILAVILGVIVLAFPISGVVAASVITGFAVIMIGIWLLVASISQIEVSKVAGILNLVLGIIVLIIGMALVFQPEIFVYFAGLILYLAGILMVLSGIINLLARNEYKNALWSGIISIVLGILYFVIATLALDPIYLGILIGCWLIITGFLSILEK